MRLTPRSPHWFRALALVALVALGQGLVERHVEDQASFRGHEHSDLLSTPSTCYAGMPLHLDAAPRARPAFCPACFLGMVGRGVAPRLATLPVRLAEVSFEAPAAARRVGDVKRSPSSPRGPPAPTVDPNVIDPVG